MSSNTYVIHVWERNNDTGNAWVSTMKDRQIGISQLFIEDKHNIANNRVATLKA